jgi:membrane protein required for colicin V production
MSAVDWALIAVLGLSVLLGLLRGVIRELFSLTGWIIGVLLAARFAEPLGSMVPLDLPLAARTALVGLFIVVAALLGAALLAALLRAALAAAKLGLEDRILGGIFGLARGVIVIGIAVLLGIAAGAPRQSWWAASTLMPLLQASVRFASPLLPQSLARLAPVPG